MEEALYQVTYDENGRIWLTHKDELRELSLQDLAALARALCRAKRSECHDAEREESLVTA